MRGIPVKFNFDGGPTVVVHDRLVPEGLVREVVVDAVAG
jgi:hypothetical protein